MATRDRFECGNLGIDRKPCEDKGCCFDESNSDLRVPQCYRKNSMYNSIRMF